jgi:hypothetical protein
MTKLIDAQATLNSTLRRSLRTAFERDPHERVFQMLLGHSSSAKWEVGMSAAWADEPVRPYLVVRLMPAVYCHREAPPEVVTLDEAEA